ncbi:hypothetical protein J8M97_16350 [Gordonia polyisoprenivorans]|nr:hypothetical protein CJJ17_23640 [Gordonia polyisoprenivorans]QUD81366.1 hypothetical protein J8M97_16350 [Gordonia polyisoprenivorans]
MGRRHHTNPKPATPAPRRRKRLEDELARAKATDGQEISPWGPGWAPTVYSGLVQAYRTLLTEWPYHLAHIEKRLEHYDRVLDAMKANGRQDTDAFRELDARSFDHADMYVTVYRSMLTTEAVSEAVAGVGPVWVPDSVMTELGTPGIDMRDTRILASLGPSGLLLFERPPARMHEDLGPGTPVMPEVTVDGLLWHPKAIGAWAAHADDMAPMVVLRPLTRSTALQPLRGMGWTSSILTEATVIDVPLQQHHSVADNLSPVVELVITLAHAMHDGAVRTDVGASGSGLTVVRAA